LAAGDGFTTLGADDLRELAETRREHTEARQLVEQARATYDAAVAAEQMARGGLAVTLRRLRRIYALAPTDTINEDGTITRGEG
jgi:outer membrane protein TolC